MWILNQDKTTLNNINNCTAILIIDKRQILAEYGDAIGSFILGEYECPKEAKRIYSQITEWIGAKDAGTVFVMPPSDELC